MIRSGILPRNCPWCWRERLEFRAYPRSVRVECAKKCGYMSTLRPGELSAEEAAVAYPGSVDKEMDKGVDE